MLACEMERNGQETNFKSCAFPTFAILCGETLVVSRLSTHVTTQRMCVLSALEIAKDEKICFSYFSSHLHRHETHVSLISSSCLGLLGSSEGNELHR